jgi:cytochrome c-type biogenesis protein CcmH/NrfG
MDNFLKVFSIYHFELSKTHFKIAWARPSITVAKLKVCSFNASTSAASRATSLERFLVAAAVSLAATATCSVCLLAQWAMPQQVLETVASASKFTGIWNDGNFGT